MGSAALKATFNRPDFALETKKLPPTKKINVTQIKIVVITGAAGRIAYALLPFLCNGEIFGSNVLVELRLLDLESNRDKLEGFKMELEDSALDYLANIVITTDPDTAFLNSDVVILLGGVPRSPGM